MSKLSFKELQERATEVVSQELLNSISGGTEDSCHDTPTTTTTSTTTVGPQPTSSGCDECQQDMVTTQGAYNAVGMFFLHLFH